MNVLIEPRARSSDAPFMYLILAGLGVLGIGILAATEFIPGWLVIFPSLLFAGLVVVCSKFLSSSTWGLVWVISSLSVLAFGVVLSLLISSWMMLLPGVVAMLAVFALNFRTETLPNDQA